MARSPRRTNRMGPGRGAAHPRALLIESLERRLLLAGLIVQQLDPLPVDRVEVSIVDPSGELPEFHDQIRVHAEAATAAWGRRVTAHQDAAIEVEVRVADIPRASGASATSNFVGVNGPLDVFEQGMGAEIRSGIDPNGPTPDVVLTLGPDYVRDELWFDPDPASRTAPVPAGRIDAFSIFLHEVGHALFLNGWHDPIDGSMPSTFQSTFDQWIEFDGENMFFTGSKAEAEYGGPVPLTSGNRAHLGNAADSGRPGDDLTDDLMNGVVFFFQQRYEISPLDVAILEDTGLIPDGHGLATVVSEQGTTDSFRVSLDTAPASDVVVEVKSQRTSEATVSRQTLTFTPQDWSLPQEVTVTGVDDSDRDGDQQVTVTVSVVTAGSDPAFIDAPPQNVAVWNLDDEPSFPWHNSLWPEDVTGDGGLTTDDVRTVFSMLLVGGGGALDPLGAPRAGLMVDVIHDQLLSTEDLRQTFARLLLQSSGAEGQAAATEWAGPGDRRTARWTPLLWASAEDDWWRPLSGDPGR